MTNIEAGTWRNLNVFRFKDGKLVAEEDIWGWNDMLIETGAIQMPKPA